MSFSRIKLLSKLDIIGYLYYNYFCSCVRRAGKGKIVPMRGAVIELHKTSRITIGEDHFVICSDRPAGSKANAYVRLRQDSRLDIQGNVVMAYGSTLELHSSAEVSIGRSYINVDSVILSAVSISIGQGVLISREVYIYDADHHPIYNDNGEITNPPKPVFVGDHVWIGLKATVLRGSKIGDGAVISANSLVGGRIKAGTLALGNPARSYSRVKWEES